MPEPVLHGSHFLLTDFLSRAHTVVETMIPMEAVAAMTTTTRTEAAETRTMIPMGLLVEEMIATAPVIPAPIPTAPQTAMTTPPHPIPTAPQDAETMIPLTHTARRAATTTNPPAMEVLPTTTKIP
jgi:hypothetical protein